MLLKGKAKEEFNKHAREIKDEKSETLVIRIDGGLWRVIAMSGAITEKAKQQPVKVITSRPLVFWWNPYIKSVHWLDDRRLFEDVIKWNDYIELEPYTDPEFFNDAKTGYTLQKSNYELNETKYRNRVYFLQNMRKFWINYHEIRIKLFCFNLLDQL